MAMLNIEYRHSENARAPGIRRTSDGMERYLESLVMEMKAAKISAEYIDGVALRGEMNCILINGTDVRDILDGLIIIPLEENDHCDMPGSRTKTVTFGRPPSEWNRDHIEDIPDVLMKNAISKTYADLRSADDV